VTSRELLRLAAEREYAVPPLVEQEAVGFFNRRARVVDPAFEPDDDVLAICRRLDHLPLALELAAARVKVLSTKQILGRLERALPLLTGGARDLPERQRTLRGAIGWSYELLRPDERAAFRRFGVFSGGWALDAAEQVAGADLDALQSLVEKSLVRFGEERYSLLETIREFALEQLDESGEAEEIRRRHFDYFAGLAALEDTSAEAGYGLRPEALLNEHENLRAALDWAVAAGDLERAAALMILLENFWVAIDPIEGARRLEELLAQGRPARPAAGAPDPLLRGSALHRRRLRAVAPDERGEPRALSRPRRRRGHCGAPPPDRDQHAHPSAGPRPRARAPRGEPRALRPRRLRPRRVRGRRRPRIRGA
jgi:predicted ATPase